MIYVENNSAPRADSQLKIGSSPKDSSVAAASNQHLQANK